MSRDDLNDVPLHMMMVKEVKSEYGILYYSAVLRMSETECIVVHDSTESAALAKLRQQYYSWMDEPLH